LQKIKLYTSICGRTDVTFEDQTEQACLGGADAVLLDDPALSARETVALGARLREICAAHKTLFMIASRPDLALAMDADGVHLFAEDIAVEWARQILGGRKIIGRTCSSLGQANAAVEAGADYLAAGPVYILDENGRKEPRGVDLIRIVKKRVKVQVLAGGGIDLDTIDEVIKTGADGVMVERAVCGSASIREKARELKDRIARVGAEIANYRNYDDLT
jgi:thiamine-phosphate pyrophosphorylase